MPRTSPGAYYSFEADYGDSNAEDSEEELEYDLVSWKDDLAGSLDAIQSSGDFAARKNYSQFVNPGLEIAESLIPLPLLSLFADQIKAVARPVPFGRGDDTVVDPSVRLAWELNHNEFRITNPAWPAFLDTVKQDAAHSLGLFPDEIVIEPYKLLLNEKGPFFKRHKDSEKAPGMIGSIVVCLPSKHEGGQIHLSHAGEDRVYATGPNSAFDLIALAWYSDVTHEVEEVTAGHRLVLTYNVTQKAGEEKSAGFFKQQQAQVKERMGGWQTGHHNLEKLVYLLDHKYFRSSLTQNSLKGRDRAVFHVLQQVSFETGYYLFLSNLTKTDYNNCGNYGSYMDEEAGITLEHLCTPEGRKVASVLDMSDEDIIGPDPYFNRSPDSIDEAEYTGGEMAPDELRYHDSAIVLVPRDRLHSLTRSGADPWAMTTVVQDTFRKYPKDVGVRRHLLQFMDKILDARRPVSVTRSWGPTETASWKTLSMTILTVAWNLEDIPLYCKAVRSCTAEGDVPSDLIAKLATLINKSLSTPQPWDWDKCLGELLDCPIDLTQLFTALGDVEKALEKEDFKDSFRAWVALAKRVEFETASRLTSEDHGFVMDLTTALWGDQGWVQQQLTTKLHHCEDKVLITRFIGTLAEQGRANTLPGAEIIAKQILDSELPRLYLKPVNWGAYYNPREPEDVDRFLCLVEVCLKNGFIAHATGLIENLDRIPQQPICAKPARIGVVGFVPTLAHQFVHILGNLLNDHQAPFMESVRGLFAHLLRNYALAPFPIYPTRTEGWAHKRRGCSSPACQHCRGLDDFLVSPLRQTAEFAAAQQIRDHIARQLVGNHFECATDTSGCPHTLVVTKISQEGEYDADVDEYGARVRALRQQTADFRHEHFRKILGDELYGELVLLDGPAGPEIPGASVTHQTTVPSGVKREADDELNLPSAQRQRVT